MSKDAFSSKLEDLYYRICGLDADNREVLEFAKMKPAVNVSASTEGLNVRALAVALGYVPHPMRRQIRARQDDATTIRLFTEEEPIVHVSKRNLALNERALRMPDSVGARRK